MSGSGNAVGLYRGLRLPGRGKGPLGCQSGKGQGFSSPSGQPATARRKGQGATITQYHSIEDGSAVVLGTIPPGHPAGQPTQASTRVAGCEVRSELQGTTGSGIDPGRPWRA